MFSFASGFLFGRPKTDAESDAELKERVREWRRGLAREMRACDAQAREVERGVEKTKAEIRKLLAAGGQERNVRVLAGHVARAGRARERALLTKAQLNSVSLQLAESAAQVRTAHALGRSATIMALMGAVLNGPQVSADLRALGAEMTKAGIVGELVGEAVDAATGADDEAEVDDVVDGILYEVSAGALGRALPTAAPPRAAAAAAAEPDAGAGQPRARVAVADGAGGDDAQARIDRL